MKQHRKLLVIEDSRTDFLLLTRFLNQELPDFALSCATSMEELDRALQEPCWQLVLLDYNVPGIDFLQGMELIKERAPQLPIILLSGSVGDEKAVELLRTGIWDFVLKDNMLRLPSAIMHCIREAAYRRESLAAAQALRESEEHFRTIFTDSRDALMILSPDSGRFSSANPAALEMFGVSGAQEMARLSPEDLSPEFQPDGESSADKARRMTQGALEAGCMQFEWQHRRLGGESFVAEVLLSRISLKGEVVLQATVRDVSPQKRILAALRESEQFNRQVIDNAEQGIVVYGRDLRYRVWNPYMERLTGLPAREVLWRHPGELFPFLVQAGVIERLEQVLAGAQASSIRFPFEIPGQGRSGWASDTTSALRDAEGEIIGAIAMVSDISALKQSEDNLRKLSAAVEQNPAAVLITDTEGVIEYVNPAFSTMTGFSCDQVLGLTPRILKGDTPPERYRSLWQTIKAGEIWTGELRNKKKDGSSFWERDVIAPVKDHAGVITHYLAIKEDITERRSLEEQLRQAQKMEALGQLAGGVAHDFNNIMQVIMGNAQLQIMENEKHGVPCGFQQQIFDAIEKGSSLTRSLLVFSRRQALELSRFNLAKLVRDSGKLAARLLTEDISLEIEVAADDLPINGDSGLVQQMIFNLITNARDAITVRKLSPVRGRIAIWVGHAVPHATPAGEEGGGELREYALISVQDNGCGISARIRDRIFEPFFTTKPVDKGTGLGLAMIYSTVSQMNGEVTVDSAPGEGTTFHIRLPLLRGGDGAGTSVFADTQYSAGHGELILLAEDDAAVRASTEGVLTRFGYRVIAVGSGEEAVQVIAGQSEKPQLAILDVIMPGMHGPDTYHLLRQLHSELPVLFLSGYSDELLEAKGVATDRLQKPVHPMLLLSRVKRLIEESTARRSG
jgi:PAS domain S-box-containing protein